MGLFITFEGPEGSGKTTQMHLLAQYLQARGYDPLITREPGGTRIGDRVRAILLDPIHEEMGAPTEFLLFSAARAQHVQELIAPHLAQGGIVLCDRFADSSLAYQGYGYELDLEAVRSITEFATGGLVPDVSFYLDLPVETGLRRKVGGHGDDWNRMEQKGVDYHQRVRAGYLAMTSQDPDRWVVIDATASVSEIQVAIRRAIEGRGLLPSGRRVG
ncbi:MAG: dTMP kinase [Anaerolineae bacterium]|nr:dTMP kinase [Anaerolineae bacterium]